MNDYYIASSIINIFALLIIIFLTKKNQIIINEQKNICYRADCLVIIMIICELLSSICEGKQGNSIFYIVNNIANVIGFSFSPLVAVFLIFVSDGKKDKKLLFLLIPFIVNFVFVVLSPWFGWIFSISQNNIYQRGNFFYIYIITYLWGIFLLAINVFSQFKKYLLEDFILNLGIIVFLLTGTSIQIVFPSLHVTWLCVTLSVFFFYSFITNNYDKYDVLTTVLSRRTFEYRKESYRKKKKVVIVSFDVDNFKKVNDAYGHQIGDESLNIIGKKMRENFYGIGECFRIGGDEFCVFCEKITLEKCDSICKIFCEDLEKESKTKTHLPKVTYGISVYNKGEDTLETAINISDHRLYEKKMNHIKINKL